MPPEPMSRKRRYPPTTFGDGSGARGTTLSEVDAGPSAAGVNDAVCIRPWGVSTSSRSRCPQYMQNEGASPPSAVESVRWQRGHVTVMRIRRRDLGEGDYRDEAGKHKHRSGRPRG